MIVAAFVISVLALLVSAAAGFFTWRQADAAATSVRMEMRRDHADRQPEFTAVVEPVNEGGWYRLTLRLTKGELLEEVSVHIVEGEGLRFAGGQDGVPGRFDRGAASAVTPMVREAATRWRVRVEDEHDDRVLLLVKCRGESGDKWNVPVWVNMPRSGPWVMRA